MKINCKDLALVSAILMVLAAPCYAVDEIEYEDISPDDADTNTTLVVTDKENVINTKDLDVTGDVFNAIDVKSTENFKNTGDLIGNVNGIDATQTQNVINEGNIDVTGSGSDANSIGINFEKSLDLENSGSINANSHAIKSDSSGNITNMQDGVLTSINGNGINATRELESSDYNVKNEGVINAENGVGIYSTKYNMVSNSGAINANEGIKTDGVIRISNTGDISATQSGISAKNATTIYNNKNINVKDDTAVTRDEDNFGIKGEDVDNIQLEEDSKITSDAYGLIAINSKSIYNKGSITAEMEAVKLDTGEIFENFKGATISGQVGVTSEKLKKILNYGSITGTDSAISANDSNLVYNIGTLSSQNIGIYTTQTDSVNNEGTITITGSEVDSTGIKTETTDVVLNSGRISGAVYGINADGATTVSNSGNIKASSTGIVTTDTANITNYSGGVIDSDIAIDATRATTITNYGTLNATDTAILVSEYGDVQHYGDITATNKGIHFDGADGNIYMQGDINIQNSAGHKVYASNGSTVNIKSFAIDFSGGQDAANDKYADYFVYEAGSSFRFDEAVLYAKFDDNFMFGYDIPTLTSQEGSSPDGISDQFVALVKTSNPDFDAKLVNGNGSTNQRIEFNFSPKASTPQIAQKSHRTIVSNGIKFVKSDLNKVSIPNQVKVSTAFNFDFDSLGVMSVGPTDPWQGYYYEYKNRQPRQDTVPTSTKRQPQQHSPQGKKTVRTVQSKDFLKNSFFLKPYIGKLKDNSKPVGYDTDLYGVLTGVNVPLTYATVVGVHAGFGVADNDYKGSGYDTREEKSYIYSVGAQLSHLFTKSILLNVVSTAAFADNKYKDTNPENRETADYNSFSLTSEADIGYIFDTPKFTLIPKIGAIHKWYKSDGYTIENLDGPNVTYSDIDVNDIYASFAIDLYGKLEYYREWYVLPYLSLGYERALTDAKTSNAVSTGGALANVISQGEKNILTTGAAVTISNGAVNYSIGYNGYYASDLINNLLWAEARIFY